MDIKQALDIIFAVTAGKPYDRDEFIQALRIVDADTEAKAKANQAIDAYIKEAIAVLGADLAVNIMEQALKEDEEKE